MSSYGVKENTEPNSIETGMIGILITFLVVTKEDKSNLRKGFFLLPVRGCSGSSRQLVPYV